MIGYYIIRFIGVMNDGDLRACEYISRKMPQDASEIKPEWCRKIIDWRVSEAPWDAHGLITPAPKWFHSTIVKPWAEENSWQIYHDLRRDFKTRNP